MPDRKKALVVDDQAINRTFIKLYLTTSGYDVLTAEDGIQGLSACQSQRFDLVFTDIEMPNMNGIEFLRSAKKLSGYDKIPFVVLSTLDNQAVKDKVTGFGAFHYMVKPYTEAKMAELFQKLK